MKTKDCRRRKRKNGMTEVKKEKGERENVGIKCLIAWNCNLPASTIAKLHGSRCGPIEFSATQKSVPYPSLVLGA